MKTARYMKFARSCSWLETKSSESVKSIPVTNPPFTIGVVELSSSADLVVNLGGGSFYVTRKGVKPPLKLLKFLVKNIQINGTFPARCLPVTATLDIHAT